MQSDWIGRWGNLWLPLRNSKTIKVAVLGCFSDEPANLTDIKKRTSQRSVQKASGDAGRRLANDHGNR